jgi:single-strand DNA-binding protein
VVKKIVKKIEEDNLKDLNQVILIGRLAKDPELKYTNSGMPVARFPIANNDSFIQNGERKESVSFFDVNVWGNIATNCEKYLKKGSQVAITGTLKQKRWQDKNRNTRTKIEINASIVHFLRNDPGKKQKQENYSYDDPWR